MKMSFIRKVNFRICLAIQKFMKFQENYIIIVMAREEHINKIKNLYWVHLHINFYEN